MRMRKHTRSLEWACAAARLVVVKVCAVAAQPGHTKDLQSIQLERGLRIVDSPGVIFEGDDIREDSAPRLDDADEDDEETDEEEARSPHSASTNLAGSAKRRANIPVSFLSPPSRLGSVS
jgi:hypothetical protein